MRYIIDQAGGKCVVLAQMLEDFDPDSDDSPGLRCYFFRMTKNI